MSYRNTREMIMASFKDAKPKTIREIAKDTGLSRSQIGHSLMLAWRRGLILRTAKPIIEAERVNKGRGGVSHHARPYHLYLGRDTPREMLRWMPEVRAVARWLVPLLVLNGINQYYLI
jgi:predicted transcriptional regulator